MVGMFISRVISKGKKGQSYTSILLRESFRLEGKVKTRTIANISHLPATQIETLRLALKAGLPSPAASFTTIQTSRASRRWSSWTG